MGASGFSALRAMPDKVNKATISVIGIPVRYDLTILSADDPKARTIGFSMFECLGIGCFNPWGAQRILITR